MKNSKALLILILVFVLLLGGASILYSALGGDQGGGTIAAVGSESSTASSVSSETSKPESSAASSDPETSSEAEPERFPAPDFTVLDADGNQVNRSDLLGKPVILNFWASWCGPCQSEMPAFEALWQEYGDQIEFMMINLTDGSRETVETASAFIAEHGYTFPVYFDTEYSAASVYNASSIPATYLVSAEGDSVGYAIGALSEEGLQQGVDMLLGE